MTIVLFILIALLTTGCVNSTTELQLPDETVQPMLTGEDCVGIYFGIATGTVRMTEAMKTYHDVQQGPERVWVRSGLLIRRIHSVVLKEEGRSASGEGASK